MNNHEIKVKLITLTILLLFIIIPSTTQGATMTFDSAPTRELVGWTDEDPTDYIEDGIKLSFVDNHYDISGGVNGHVNIDTYGSGSTGYACTIKFEMANGSLFNLNSLYIHTNDYTTGDYEDNENFELEYKLSFSNGSSYVIDPGTDAVLLLGMNNISYFTSSVIVVSGCDYSQHNAQLDDINMTAVPEPTTILLLGLGLIALAGIVMKLKT